MSHHVIGVDIGGTKIAAAVVAPNGALASEVSSILTPVREGPEAIVDTVIGLCHQLIQRYPETIHAIGIGTAGQVDFARGVITYAVDTLPGWAGTPLRERVRTALGLPVVIDNDVNAMAAGEAQFGAGQGYESALFVTVGTGVGGALIVNGRLWRGANGSAGEIGHIVVDWRGMRMCNCGQAGHLEAYAAGPAIARHYCELAGIPAHDDLREVAQLAANGDALARKAVIEGAQILGAGLAGLLNILDVQALIIGGGVPEIGDLWWNAFEAAVRANPLPCPQRVHLRRAQLGVSATLIGAAWEAFDSLRGDGDA